jgi:peroxiredoxin
MRSVWMIFLFSVTVAYAQPPQGFHLKGLVRSGGYPVDKFVLIYDDFVQGRIRDTVPVIDGRFSFQGILASPMFVDLYVLPDSHRVEPKRRFPVLVSFPMENSPIEMNFISPGQFQINGSPLYDQYKSYVDSFQNSTRLLKGKEFTLAARQFRLDYIKAYPSSVLSLLILENMVRHTRATDGLEHAIQALDSTLRLSTMGRRISQRLEDLNMIRIGSVAPDFTLLDEKGKSYSLSNWKGKYVFLHFWGSWCKPCRNENIVLRKAYDFIDTGRIVFIGISLDQKDTRDQWVKAVSEDRLKWTQLIDMEGYKGKVVKSYRFSGVPASFLIDPGGKIEAMHVRGAALLALVQRSFSKRMPE